MAPVRGSAWPLAALVLAALAAGPAHAQIQGLADMQIRSESDPLAVSGSVDDLKPPPEPDADEPLPRKPPPPGAKRLPPRKPGDLPRLQPYKGASRLGLRGGPGTPEPTPTASDPPPEPETLPAPTVAAKEIPPPRRKIPADPNPFDPVGLRFGDIDVKPYVEENVGYATNPLGQTSSPKGSAVETTEGGLAWQSLWSRNDFHGQVKAGYTDYFATQEASGEYGSGTVDGRIDASRDLAFDAEGRFSYLPEPLSNFGVSTSKGDPFIETSTWGATLGATQKFGDLSIGLHGTFDRQTYQDPGSDGGGSVSADDYNDWGLKLKTAYRVSEALSPYVEIDGDLRRYDTGYDEQGFAADSAGLYVHAGVDVTFSQMLSGELALGYGERTYQDPRLPKAVAPLVDASLIWAVTPLTTLTLRTSSAINDAILVDASAAVDHSYSIDIGHSFTRQLSADLIGTLSTDRYVGNTQSDLNWSLGVKAEYHVTRDLVFKVSATRSAYVPNQAGQSSSNDVFLVGIRLQR